MPTAAGCWGVSRAEKNVEAFLGMWLGTETGDGCMDGSGHAVSAVPGR